jgi:hypothetical protein
MTQRQGIPAKQGQISNRKFVVGIWAILITRFASFLFLNARNIAQPVRISGLDGLSLFSWLVAFLILSGATSTLLFG